MVESHKIRSGIDTVNNLEMYMLNALPTDSDVQAIFKKHAEKYTHSDKVLLAETQARLSQLEDKNVEEPSNAERLITIEMANGYNLRIDTGILKWLLNNDQHIDVRNAALRAIPNAKPSDMHALLKWSMDNMLGHSLNEDKIQDMIMRMPPQQMEESIEYILNNPSTMEQKIGAARSIITLKDPSTREKLNDSFSRSLLSAILNKTDYIHYYLALALDHMPREAQYWLTSNLLEKLHKSDFPIKFIDSVKSIDRLELISDTIDNLSRYNEMTSHHVMDLLKLLMSISTNERSRLTRRAMAKLTNPLHKIMLTEVIMSLEKPEDTKIKDEITQLIIDVISPDSEVQLLQEALNQIRYLPEDRRLEVYKLGENPRFYMEIRRIVLDQIKFLPQTEKMDAVMRILKQGRGNAEDYQFDTLKAILLTRLIDLNLNIDEIETVLRYVLEKENNHRVLTNTLKIISNMPNDIRYRLMEHIPDHIDIDEKEYNPYGIFARFDTDKSRKKIDKGGSDLYLGGGGPIKTIGEEGAIIHGREGFVFNRNIPIRSFFAWRHVFEASDVWASHGFDYVPIVPILGFNMRSNNNMHIRSILIGSNIRDINLQYYKDDIVDQKEKIENVLATMGLQHYHLHDGNYCIRYDANANGEEDRSKPPRVYVIDFDSAVLEPTIEQVRGL